MTKEQQWFHTSNLIQSCKRWEEIYSAGDHFKCWKAIAADAAGYEFSSVW